MSRALQTREKYTNQICCLFGISAPAAERYLSIGHLIRAGLFRGLTMGDIARSTGLSSSECEWALRYVDSPISLKFEALAECWSWKQIKRAIVRADSAMQKQVMMRNNQLVASPKRQSSRMLSPQEFRGEV